ncbi:chitinase-3-like protein 1 [Rhipicephalus microplus]|uniref:chitinase-3-like protein 1 n=1 Tax=Rhipicephalus microplus TaxID=6941 RepID=UPI003F6CC0C9
MEDNDAPAARRSTSRRISSDDESILRYIMRDHNFCLMALLVLGVLTVTSACIAIVAAVFEHYWTSINDDAVPLMGVTLAASADAQQQYGRSGAQIAMQRQLDEDASRIVLCFANYSAAPGSPHHFDVDNASAILCDAHVLVSLGLDVEKRDLRFKRPVEDAEALLKMVALSAPTWACVGGEAADSEDFRLLMRERRSRLAFVRNAASWSRRNGLAGLVLYWKYPTRDDRTNFSTFVNTMRVVFDQEELRVSVVIPWEAARRREGYHVPALYSRLDFVIVDTHRTVNPATFPVATCQSPMRPVFRARHNGQMGLSSVLDDLSMVTDHMLVKTVLSVSFASATFTLKRHWIKMTRAGMSVLGPGRPFRHTNRSGLASYYEVTEALIRNASHWHREIDGFSRCSVAYSGDQWIGFEDRASLRSKRAVVRRTSGLAVWDITMDDFAGDLGPTWQLLREAHDLVHG